MSVQLQMAGTNGDIFSIGKKIEKLTILGEESTKNEDDSENGKKLVPRLWGFETKELYKIAVNFYKGKSIILTVY